jgi:iron(III) transport system ATP-binding protein
MSFLQLRAVCKRYDATDVLKNVDVTVPRGSRTAILGPSGSGKSTLLRIIGGFEVPDAGQVVMDGDVLTDGPRAVAPHLRGIGLVAQEGALFPHMTVADNIGFGLPRHAPDRDTRIATLVAMVELEPAMLRRRPDQLSGGQQQRVALARALARRPRVMLLDEPFAALDAGLRISTRKVVAALLGKEGVTTILVTHDQTEALSFADQVVVIHDGRVLQAGTPQDLYLRPTDATVARFMGDAVILPGMANRGRVRCALGDLPLSDATADGDVEIMLRMEQILLVATPLMGQADLPLARVVDAEFGGGTCAVTVVIPTIGSSGEMVLTVRSTYLALPEPGSPVQLVVEGVVHVLGAGPRSQPRHDDEGEDLAPTGASS